MVLKFNNLSLNIDHYEVPCSEFKALDTYRLIHVSLLYFLNKLDTFDLHHILAEWEPTGMLSPWIITWQEVIRHAYFTNTEYYGHISQL